MNKCSHRYGVVFAQTKDTRTRIINREIEISHQKEQMYKYPCLPETLWVFNYCPDCGETLLKGKSNES